MLTLSTRTRYTTLLDAETLRQPADRPAIIYLSIDAAPITVSRADFARSIRAYGAALRGMGIAPRDLVIIAHTQNLESIFAFWGALLIGAIYGIRFWRRPRSSRACNSSPMPAPSENRASQIRLAHR